LKCSLKQKSAMLAVIVLAALLTYAHLICNAQAQGCNIKVEAPAEVQPNTTFSVSIIAENIPDQVGGMAGWELVLSWNSSVMNCTGEIPNYAFWVANSGPLVGSPIDNDTGTYHQGLALRSPSDPVAGTYWLANVTFQSSPRVSDETDLAIGPGQGLTYCLVDKNAIEIEHGFTNSHTHIVPEFLETLLLPLLIALSAASIMLATKMRKHQ